jgi:hypothetical protein
VSDLAELGYNDRVPHDLHLGGASMSQLEERVSALEKRVAALEKMSTNGRQKDWRRTVGMFTGDQGMQELFKEAMKLREADRKRTRRRHEPRKKRARA